MRHHPHVLEPLPWRAHDIDSSFLNTAFAATQLQPWLGMHRAPRGTAVSPALCLGM